MIYIYIYIYTHTYIYICLYNMYNILYVHTRINGIHDCIILSCCIDRENIPKPVVPLRRCVESNDGLA